MSGHLVPTVEALEVPVAGGRLAVTRWPGEGPLVLAAHGITSNALAWAPVAAALAGRATLVAPDLRGRAGSAALPGPYGIARHAEDLLAVLDALGAERAVLAGHSMGGFAACTAAVRAPARVERLVLVDGGVAFGEPPPVAEAGSVLEAALGPALARLAMTFADREAYRSFWQEHPAFAGAWSPAIDAHVQHDLAGAEPALRSSCVEAAVREDGAQLLTDPQVLEAAQRLPCPATLLWAGRGLLDDPPGLYGDGRAEGAPVPAREVPGTNHYTILLAEPGASAVADELLSAPSSPGPW